MGGTEGLKVLEDQSFDLIFLDIQMPDLSGYDVLKELRIRKNKTPTIVVSANSFSEDREASLRLGALDHVSKPFNKDQIFNCLKVVEQLKKAS